jgi:RES domain-containing protein
MRLWRVSIHSSIDGEGGPFVAGRWHSRGRRVTYCSLHPATALLEWIAHLELDIAALPSTIPYTVVEAPANVSTEQTRELPENWRQDVTVTRAIGDEWLSSARTSILLVPSAIVPEAQNVLLNPAHRELESIRVVERRAEPFDFRLIKKS